MESSIKVKLLSSGKYTWEINIIFNEHHPKECKDVTGVAKQIDNQLREQFPNHVQVSSSKVVDLDE